MASAGIEPVPKPRIIVCDTDALIQIFLADQGELLKKIRRVYGIQPIVPEAVEVELTNPRQPKSSQFLAKAQKALDNGALIVLDERTIGAFTSNDPHSTYTSIQLLGQKSNIHVGKGEAFVHAAALVLRAPALSNDLNAFNTLDRVGLKQAQYVLRAYDIFVLFHQIGELQDNDLDGIRDRLLSVGKEAIPTAFQKRKFTDGLPYFCPRIIDGSCAQLATGYESELPDRNRLIVQPIKAHETTSKGSVATLRDIWPADPEEE